eukprot:TRINITY_DN2598_c0_g1_i1.p1 TRINITY_DN2598_c0_g1~~TRINITY_DN2598_c0_g1_i1.p1  ORF type:complete len:626 (-),score=156.17 TRINITY_DN2598_c0_g1_i1:540-2279(-)
MIAWLLVMAVATCCARDSALAGSNAVFGTTVGLVMLTIVLTHVQILSADATTVRDNLSELVDFLDANPVANAQLQQYLRLELCQRFLLGQVAFFFFIMNNMQYTIYTLWGVLAHALSATILVVSVCLSPAVPAGGQLFLIYLLVPILSSYYDCANISTSRRHLYATQYNLRHALERKSAALLEAWTVEQAQREASQEADSILNHILKNIMADAAGCIDMFLENVDGDQHLLQQALGGLYRGMRWCKHRQAILRITAGGDCAVVEAPVDVNELGYALVLGRDVDHRFEEGTVLLDSTLCSIVLDNAINNAFRHGCQKDPQVRFTIEVGPPTDPEATDVRRVAFTISNRANPARPVISQELIDKFLAATAPTTSGSLLSDHLGLRHMFAAAAAQRMTVALSQDDGVVTFEASVEARVCSMTRMNSTKAPADFGAMPEGLRILCLDDSEVARKLLVHCLHAHSPGVGGAGVRPGPRGGGRLPPCRVHRGRHLGHGPAPHFRERHLPRHGSRAPAPRGRLPGLLVCSIRQCHGGRHRHVSRQWGPFHACEGPPAPGHRGAAGGGVPPLSRLVCIVRRHLRFDR